MRIIKYGPVPTTPSSLAIERFECECGCIFEANKNEYNKYTFMPNVTYVCKCPSCGMPVVFDKKYEVVSLT